MKETIGRADEHLQQLIEETRTLRAEVIADSTHRIRALRRSLALLLGTAVLAGSTLVLTVYYRHLGAQTRGAITTIKDCTQPEGKCYRDGQARTGAAVAEIARQNARTNVEIVACAMKSTAATDFRACVRHALPGVYDTPPIK